MILRLPILIISVFPCFSLQLVVFRMSSSAATIPPIKAQLRKEIKSILKSLSVADIQEQSAAITTRVLTIPAVQSSRCPCIFLSMPQEVDTSHLIQEFLNTGRAIYLPKVYGKKSGEMTMVKVSRYEDILSFPKNAWGIPEPEIDINQLTEDYLEEIDLMIMPGVAFDGNCARLGHGKGYYDCFLEKLIKHKISRGLLVPPRVALALQQQIVDCVPVEGHDLYLDYVVTPNSIMTMPDVNK